MLPIASRMNVVPCELDNHGPERSRDRQRGED